MGVLALADVFSYFCDDRQAFAKGERKYNDGYVLSFELDGFGARSFVQASMKDRSYEVRVTFLENGKIGHTTCECPRGVACCSHKAATLLYAALCGMSKTDLPLQWIRHPKSAKPKETATFGKWNYAFEHFHGHCRQACHVCLYFCFVYLTGGKPVNMV